MTLLAPQMILNLRRGYYSHVPDFSTIRASSGLTWDADRPMSTMHDSIQESGIGVWSAEMGAYVTGRRVVYETDESEEE